MIDIACVVVCIICMFISGACLSRCKQAEHDRDKYFQKWMDVCGKFDRCVESWGKTLNLCERINNNNGDIIGFNKALIKRLDKKEKYGK